MTQKGPIPKPGPTHGHRRSRPLSIIDPVDGPPAAPADLGPAGRAAWDQWWRSAAWLAASDVPVVRLLCHLIDREAELDARIAADGLTVSGSQSQPVANPLLGVAATVRSLIVGLANDCGFTPAGRRRLGIVVEPRKPLTSLDKLVARRHPYDHLRPVAAPDDPA